MATEKKTKTTKAKAPIQVKDLKPKKDAKGGPIYINYSKVS